MLKSLRTKVGIVLKILAVIRINNLGEIRVSEFSDGRVKWEQPTIASRRDNVCYSLIG